MKIVFATIKPNKDSIAKIFETATSGNQICDYFDYAYINNKSFTSLISLLHKNLPKAKFSRNNDLFTIAVEDNLYGSALNTIFETLKTLNLTLKFNDNYLEGFVTIDDKTYISNSKPNYFTLTGNELKFNKSENFPLSSIENTFQKIEEEKI